MIPMHDTFAFFFFRSHLKGLEEHGIGGENQTLYGNVERYFLRDDLQQIRSVFMLLVVCVSLVVEH